MTRFYDPPIRFWYKSTDGVLHTIIVLAWDMASDTFKIEDTCCVWDPFEVTHQMLAKGTAAPWHAASVLEADRWLEARVSLGLANTYTY